MWTRRISTVLSYPAGDQARVVAAAVLLLSLPPALTFGSFDRIRTGLLRVVDAAAAVVPGDPAPERIAHTVALVDGGLPGSRTCLVRSLTAETLLRLYGYEPEHRIGVDKVGETEMKAHSWIEHDGEILIGDLENLSRYQPLQPLDGETS